MNAYTQAPVCTPARISILTGQYCSQTGVWRDIGNHPLQFDLLTDLFKEAGYRSATFGKQHYGGPKRASTQRRPRHERVRRLLWIWCESDESLHDVVKYPDTWVLGSRFPEPAEVSRERNVRGAINGLKKDQKSNCFCCGSHSAHPIRQSFLRYHSIHRSMKRIFTCPQMRVPCHRIARVDRSGLSGSRDWPFTPERSKRSGGIITAMLLLSMISLDSCWTRWIARVPRQYHHRICFGPWHTCV